MSFSKPNLRPERAMRDFEVRDEVDRHALLYVPTKKLIWVSKRVFSKKEGPVLNIQGSLYKIMNNVGEHAMSRTAIKAFLARERYSAESGMFGDMAAGLFAIKDALTAIGAMAPKVKAIISFIPIVVDFIADIYLIGKLRITSLEDILVGFYKIYTNAARLFSLVEVGQAMARGPVVVDDMSWGFTSESMDAFIMSLASLTFPAKIFEIFKRMSVFTGRRLIDDAHWFYDFLSLLIEYVIGIMKYFKVPEEWLLKVDTLLSFLPFAPRAMSVTKMTNLIDEYQADGSRITRDNFREKIKTLYVKLSEDLNFSEMANRSAGLKLLYLKFSTLYKSVLSYEEATRVEPCLFVIEGPPGCMKSVHMQQLLSCFKKDGKTVFTHTFKATEDSKDWYDTYDNQHLFVADDVGQQGVSQWRHMINMVSPIKLPLDCATAHLKHTKYFSSELIMVTTNRFINLNGVTSKDCISELPALWRRGYVFDFSSVSRLPGTGTVNGRINFLVYDIADNGGKWKNAFPDGFEPEGKVPFFENTGDRIATLKWMYSIMKSLNEWKKTQNSINEMTDEQIQSIIRPTAEVRPRDLPDFIRDTMPPQSTWALVKEMIDDFVSSVLNSINNVAAKVGVNNVDFKPFLIHVFIGVAVLSVYYLWYKLIGYAFMEDMGTPLGGYSKKDEAMGNAIEKKLVRKRNEYVSQNEVLVNKIKSVEAKDLPPTAVPYLSERMYEIDLIWETIDTSGKKVEFLDTTMALWSGHHLLIVAHSLLPGRVSVTIYRDRKLNNKFYENIECKISLYDRESDLAILSLPTPLVMVKASLHKHFKPDAVFEQTKHLWYVSHFGVAPLFSLITGNASKEAKSYTIYDGQPFEEEVPILQNDLCYTILQGQGLCGSLIYHATKGIIGMHVAGSAKSGKSMAKIWPTELLQRICDVLSNDENIVDVPISSKVLENFSGIKLDIRANVRTQKKTNLVKTPLHGLFGGTKEPVNLTVYGNHTVKDLAKGGFEATTHIPFKDLDFMASVIDVIIPEFEECTELEVIRGFDMVAPLKKDTSNGHGLESDRTLYIDFEKGEVTPLFRKMLDQFESDIENGLVNLDNISLEEHLKDELRPLSKRGVPRTFQVAPLTLMFLQKKYFGKMVNGIVKTRHQHGIMIGMNPYVEWPLLHGSLSACQCFGSDVGKFERTINAEIQQNTNRVTENKYKGKRTKVLRFLGASMISSLILVNDDVFMKNHNMPSGHYLTAIYNSLYRKQYTAGWFSRFATNPSVSSFFSMLSDYVYGDDGVTGVKVKFIKDNPELNNLTMSKYMKAIGIDYTTDTKTPVTDAFTPLDQITFLKRSFRVHPSMGTIVCPLSMTTINSMLDYRDSTKDPMVVMEGKVNCTLREIFLHCTYNEYTIIEKVVKQECGKHGIPVPTLSYSYLCHLYQHDIYSFAAPMYENKMADFGLNYRSENILSPLAGGKAIPVLGQHRNNRLRGVNSSKSVKQLFNGLFVSESHSITNLNNIDELKSVGERANERALTQQDIKDNVESVMVDYGSDLRTKTVLDSGRMYCDKDKLISISPNMRMNFDQILSKPFYLKRVSWGTGDTSGATLASSDILVPTDLLVNALAKIPFQASAFVRGCIEITATLVTTPLHAGTVVISATSPSQGTEARGINSDLIAPHVILTANSSSSAVLEVPFYYPARLYPCGVPLTDTVYATNVKNFSLVTTRVLNALVVSTGATTPVSIMYYGMFKDLEFYVPHNTPTYRTSPDASTFVAESSMITKAIDSVTQTTKTLASDFIDAARGTLRKYTGLHNPNLPIIHERMIPTDENFANITDGQTLYQKLDPYVGYDRFVREETFNTSIDEMDISQMVRKPQLISVLNMPTTLVAGSQLATFPMTPLMVPVTVESRNYPLIQKLHAMSGYWRGDLYLDFHSVSTNFQRFQIQVTRDYTVSPASFDKYPTMDSVSNMPSTFLEFNAGGQVQTVKIPFQSPFNQLPCALDARANAVQHGLCYVFLAAPVINGANAPSSVRLNVFLRAGENFQFFGYCKENVVREDTTIALFNAISGPLDPSKEDETDHIPSKFIAESNAATPYNVSIPTPLLNANVQSSSGEEDLEMRPIVNVRDHLRRHYLVYDEDFVTTGVEFNATVALLLLRAETPLKHIIRDFRGYTGDLKFKIVFVGAPGFMVKFYPPGWSQAGTVVGSNTLQQSFTGAIQTRVLDAKRYLPTVIGDQALKTAAPFIWHSRKLIKEDDDIAITSGSGTGLVNYDSGISQVEFTLPNYSPFKFISTSAEDHSVDPEADYGRINIAPIVRKTIPADSRYRIRVYIAVGDSFRCGFHIFNRPFKYRTLTAGVPALPYLEASTSSQSSSTPISEFTSPQYYRRTTLSDFP